jgi:hypothetical protein
MADDFASRCQRIRWRGHLYNTRSSPSLLLPNLLIPPRTLMPGLLLFCVYVIALTRL